MSGGGGGKRQMEEEHEEHENHERWLVSYADMMTLLMVLFIVLFAISQVNQKKFDQLKTGFGASGSLDGGQSLLNDGQGVAPDPEVAKQPDAAEPGTSQEVQVNEQAVAQLAKAQEQQQVKSEVENLKEAQEEIAAALKKAGVSKKVTFKFDERGLIISIATDDVLFGSGSASLSNEGKEILNAIGPDLRALPNRIDVEGHTNSIPIRTAVYPSNWELSGGRASSVLRYLAAAQKVPAKRMMATGYANTMPLVPDSDPSSVSRNRRVEIVVIARVDDSAGRAVAELGNADEDAGLVGKGNVEAAAEALKEAQAAQAG